MKNSRKTIKRVSVFLLTLSLIFSSLNTGSLIAFGSNVTFEESDEIDLEPTTPIDDLLPNTVSSSDNQLENIENDSIENIEENTIQNDIQENTNETYESNDIDNEDILNNETNEEDSSLSEENIENSEEIENEPKLEIVENKEEEIVEEEIIKEVSTIEDLSTEVSELSANDNLNNENIYTTKRLIVSSNVEFDVSNTLSVVNYGNLYILTYENEELCENAHKQLLENKDILFVEVDKVIETSTISNEEIIEKVESKVINNNDINKDVVVGIIDTGIDKQNNLFANRIIDIEKNLSSTGESNSIQDDNGHGTAVASIIAKNSNVMIMPIKIVNSEGKGTVLNLYLAI